LSPEFLLAAATDPIVLMIANAEDSMLKHKPAGSLAFTLIFGVSLSAQSPSEHQTTQQQTTQDSQPQTPCANASQPPCGGSSVPTGSTPATVSTPATTNKQPSRILGFVPNFRAVSADTQLPPLSGKGKFKLYLRQNFDYSSLIMSGIGAGFSQATDSPKQFGQGGIGYGRRYWHVYADAIGSNFFTNFLVPTLAHQDPRYYSLGHGGVLRRTGYAVSRLFVIKSDAGNWTLNISEPLGNLLGASVSNAYYPSSLTGWTHTYQRWGLQLGIDGGFNLLKEFWPDVSPSKKNKGTLAGQNTHP
jgi:hypothetical protein